MFNIYKITNIINNKAYIGQTKYDINHRFQQHCSKWSCCTKLKNAIKKYGKENFNIELLDTAVTKDKADELEIKYINKYKTKEQRYGYNLQDGGYTTNPSTRKKVICLETNQIYESVSQLADEIGATVDKIARVCRGEKPTYKGFHYSYLDKYGNPINSIHTKPNKIKVMCVETGKIYSSIKEASDTLNKSRFAVGYACQKENRTCGGYHWKYYKDVT